MSFNTETAYLLWDDEHDTAGVKFVREDANSVVFDYNGTELVFEQENVVNLGSAHPPAQKEAGKHYVSTDDSGASNQEYSVVSENNSSENNLVGNSQGSGSSQATGPNETAQSGGRRKKGKKTKKVKSRRTKAKKTKKAKKSKK